VSFLSAGSEAITRLGAYQRNPGPETDHQLRAQLQLLRSAWHPIVLLGTYPSIKQAAEVLDQTVKMALGAVKMAVDASPGDDLEAQAFRREKAIMALVIQLHGELQPDPPWPLRLVRQQEKNHVNPMWLEPSVDPDSEPLTGP
jgi:hypothetical protein